MLMPRVVLVGLALVAMLSCAAGALAASPRKGAKYSGHVREAGVPITISFKVSRSGRKVTSLTLNVPNLPNKCGYGGPDAIRPAHAKIKDGRFTAKLSETTGGSTVVATARITGRFRAGGKESGKIRTKTSDAACSGTFRYATRVSTSD
jgi:hypothetical protein